MSKEFIRKSIEGRFSAFTGIPNTNKGYENRQDPPVPQSGQWANIYIDHVLRKVASIGSAPCTRRTGVVTIQVFDRRGAGTASINRLTDEIENYFSFYQEGNLWLDAAVTINDRGSETYYESTVYVPYTYDDQ